MSRNRKTSQIKPAASKKNTGGPEVLAIDIGTSGCRAALFSGSGRVLTVERESYGYKTGALGFVEQDPEEVFEKFLKAVKAALNGTEAAPRYIIVSSVLHSLILLGRDGRPLAPMSIWADRRAAGECLALEKTYRDGLWSQRTGCLLSPSYPLYRLVWYKVKRPGIFRKTAKAVSIKSYILSRLSGCFLEDYSTASGTGLFNIREFEWDRHVLRRAGISPEILPEAVPVDFRVPVQEGAKKRFGLPAEWVIGASDGPLAHLGSAGIEPGAASLTLGTSGAARVHSTRPAASEDSQLWCYVLGSDSYILGCSTNNGGNVIDWFTSRFLPRCNGWTELEKRLKSTRADEDLMFAPYLFGERVIDSRRESAAFSGLKASHSVDDMLRAVVEGVVFNAVSMLERLRTHKEIRSVATTGSLCSSGFVRGLLSMLVEGIRFSESGVSEGLFDIIKPASGVRAARAGHRRSLSGRALSESLLCKTKYEKWKLLHGGRNR